mgnify:CR=1 FL=1|jgi:hypothetical protein|tara:strand:+ start:354 stop:680 length:327 start_codon:yes stop_codon:yes gene_type:complete
MWNFRTGDLIAQTHPAIEDPLKVGIVIEDNETTFDVKWTSYNKTFFMEKEYDIYSELNNSYLLTTVQIHRRNVEANLLLLSSIYFDDEYKRSKGKTSQTNSETNGRQS